MVQKGKRQILTPEEKAALRIHVRRKFKVLVQLIIYNKRWLEGNEDESELGDNAIKNIQMMLGKKKEKSLIGRHHKSIMMKESDKRTFEEIEELARVLPSNKFFRKYDYQCLLGLAKTLKFYYYPAGVRIYSQGCPPLAIYVILEGECNGLYKYYDRITHSTSIATYGQMRAGYAIGIVNVLTEKPRSLTVETAVASEIVGLAKEHFDKILKASYLKTFKKMAAHYNKFPNLRYWPADTKRVCSILCKWRLFKPNQLLLDDHSSLKDYAFFIISGTCYLLECLVVKVKRKKKLTTYTLANKEEVRRLLFKTSDDSIQSKEIDHDLVRIETHFIKICDFRALACFNIGENIGTRQVIAKTRVHCLLIPKVWLLHQNINNVWTIITGYLNRTIPDTQTVFKEFLQQMFWSNYKLKLVKEIMDNYVITNANFPENLPFSTRLSSPEYFTLHNKKL